MVLLAIALPLQQSAATDVALHCHWRGTQNLMLSCMIQLQPASQRTHTWHASSDDGCLSICMVCLLAANADIDSKLVGCLNWSASLAASASHAWFDSCHLFAGAPHKVDEGAALWFGTGCEKGNIANVANKRGSSWGTMVNGTDGCTA